MVMIKIMLLPNLLILEPHKEVIELRRPMTLALVIYFIARTVLSSNQ
jgi:hypothetical protein